MSTYEGYLTSADFGVLVVESPLAQLVGDNPLYIGDDWDDNLLAVRDRAVGGAIIPFERFRPVWTTVAGAPFAAGGVLVTPAGNVALQHLRTPSTFAVGTWEIDVQWQAARTAGSSLYFFFFCLGVGLLNSYDIHWSGLANSYFLVKTVLGVGAVLITELIAEDLAWHVWGVTRDGAGNFELFRNGVSKGVAANVQIVTSDYINILSDVDAVGHWDNLEVY